MLWYTLVFACLPHAMLAAQMFFTIDWPHNHIFGAEHLKLCFETTEEAHAWYGALECAIGAPPVLVALILGHECPHACRFVKLDACGSGQSPYRQAEQPLLPTCDLE